MVYTRWHRLPAKRVPSVRGHPSRVMRDRLQGGPTGRVESIGVIRGDCEAMSNLGDGILPSASLAVDLPQAVAALRQWIGFKLDLCWLSSLVFASCRANQDPPLDSAHRDKHTLLGRCSTGTKKLCAVLGTASRLDRRPLRRGQHDSDHHDQYPLGCYNHSALATCCLRVCASSTTSCTLPWFIISPRCYPCESRRSRSLSHTGLPTLRASNCTSSASSESLAA